MSDSHSLPASEAIVLFVALLDEGPDMLKGSILVNDKSEFLGVSFRHFRRPEDPHGDAHRCRGRKKWTVVRLDRKIGGMEGAPGRVTRARLRCGDASSQALSLQRCTALNLQRCTALHFRSTNTTTVAFCSIHKRAPRKSLLCEEQEDIQHVRRTCII
jgi:hypothetical protein